MADIVAVAEAAAGVIPNSTIATNPNSAEIVMLVIFFMLPPELS